MTETQNQSDFMPILITTLKKYKGEIQVPSTRDANDLTFHHEEVSPLDNQETEDQQDPDQNQSPFHGVIYNHNKNR